MSGSPALTVRLEDAQLDELARRVAAHLAAEAPAEDRWLDLAQAAEHLDTHPDTLRKRAKAGFLPYEQEGPGCRMYFRRSELDAYRRSGGAPAAVAALAALSPPSRRNAS